MISRVVDFGDITNLLADASSVQCPEKFGVFAARQVVLRTKDETSDTGKHLKIAMITSSFLILQVGQFLVMKLACSVV